MEATSFRTYQVLWFLYLFSNFIVHNFHQIDLFPILEFAAIALFLKKHRSIQLSFSVLLFCSNGSVYVSLLKFRLYMIEIEAQDNFFDMCILLITCHLSLSINCKLALCHWEFVWTLCNHRQGGPGFASYDNPICVLEHLLMDWIFLFSLNIYMNFIASKNKITSSNYLMVNMIN